MTDRFLAFMALLIPVWLLVLVVYQAVIAWNYPMTAIFVVPLSAVLLYLVWLFLDLAVGLWRGDL